MSIIFYSIECAYALESLYWVIVEDIGWLILVRSNLNTPSSDLIINISSFIFNILNAPPSNNIGSWIIELLFVFIKYSPLTNNWQSFNIYKQFGYIIKNEWSGITYFLEISIFTITTESEPLQAIAYWYFIISQISVITLPI